MLNFFVLLRYEWKRNEVHIVWRAVHVGFFIHTSIKRKKINCQFFYIIEFQIIFMQTLREKQLWNKAKFKLIRKRKNKLTNGQGGTWLFNSELPSLKESEMSKYRLFKLFSFAFFHCRFHAFFIFDSNATDVTLFTRRNARFCKVLFDITSRY